MLTQSRNVGDLLREWRLHRRVSQLDLSMQAGVSARHISFLENGRSRPSRRLLMVLAEALDVPLRERNALLLAAGFSPEYSRTPLDHPSLTAAKAAIDLVLNGHEPYPALAVDRYWNLVAANSAVGRLLAGVSPELLEAPVNALRVSMHPDGLAPRIHNFAGWREHLLTRLRRQIDAKADPLLQDLYDELAGYPATGAAVDDTQTFTEFAIPLRLATPDGLLSFITTTTVFGSVHDITLDEMAIESFYPADAATAAAFASSKSE